MLAPSRGWLWLLEYEVGAIQAGGYAQDCDRSAAEVGQVDRVITVARVRVRDICKIQGIPTTVFERAQVDLVSIDVEIHDAVVAVAGGEDEGVRAGAAVQEVVAGAADLSADDAGERRLIRRVFYRVCFRGLKGCFCGRKVGFKASNRRLIIPLSCMINGLCWPDPIHTL